MNFAESPGGSCIVWQVAHALELGQLPERAHEATARTWREFDGNQSLSTLHRQICSSAQSERPAARLCRAQKLWLVAGDQVLGCASSLQRLAVAHFSAGQANQCFQHCSQLLAFHFADLLKMCFALSCALWAALGQKSRLLWCRCPFRSISSKMTSTGNG